MGDDDVLEGHDDILGLGMEGLYGGIMGYDAAEGYGTGRGVRRRAAEQKEVTFTAVIDTAPGPNQHVFVSSNELRELQQELAMEPCETGGRRLWRASAWLAVPHAAAGAAGSALSSSPRLASLESAAGESVPMFSVTYSIRGGGGIRWAESSITEPAPLRAFYYHWPRFPAAQERASDAFALLFQEEVHLLQTGRASQQQFLSRFYRLAQAPFAEDRRSLDASLEELILRHWGEEARPPPQTVLAMAAALGYFRRRPHPQQKSAGSFVSLPGGSPPQPEAGAGTPGRGQDGGPPPSLVVCRWIARHCPPRSELPEEPGARTQRPQECDLVSRFCVQRDTQMGVLFAVEVLYLGEKTFEWLRLLGFLREYTLPEPISISLCTAGERDKIVQSFLHALGEVVGDIQQQQRQLRELEVRDAEERSRHEQELASSVERSFTGLASFCPSADCLHKLVLQVQERLPDKLDIVMPLVFGRLQTLHFGSQDKDALRKMIRDIPAMRVDACAAALLQSKHHPSDAFAAAEIVRCVQEITEHTARGDERQQLLSALRRWLARHYGHAPEKADRWPGEDQRNRPAS
ncbi:unnamed protein product [Prorocentrum cordatum]|uniref:Uncharacterized protein n=1 Tax=Prorocentrum cordatum TaxID=2364126 RepID=A0ABN9VQ54_9DINO|nr:unnamed protein product [Polarella glacialis]